MKKFTFLGLVLVLLAFTAIPVFAGSPNGHGNGGNAGQSSGNGNQDQNKGQGVGHGQKNKNNTFGEQGNGNQGKRMRTPFYLQGTIASISGAEAMTTTLTISVTHGNAQVKQFIGSDITITVTTADIFEINQVGEPEGTTTESPTTNSTDDETPGNRVPITKLDLKVGDIVAIHGNVVGDVFQATLITVYIRTPETGETISGTMMTTGQFGLSGAKFGMKRGLVFKLSTGGFESP